MRLCIIGYIFVEFCGVNLIIIDLIIKKKNFFIGYNGN